MPELLELLLEELAELPVLYVQQRHEKWILLFEDHETVLVHPNLFQMYQIANKFYLILSQSVQCH